MGGFGAQRRQIDFLAGQGLENPFGSSFQYS